MRRLLAAAALSACAVVSGGCSSSAQGAPGAVRVVAATDVWSDVVSQIAGGLAGSKVVISSFINSATADPHSYEASVRDQLAISKADLVIENGGGYDGFMNTLRDAAGGSAEVINAVTVSGKRSVDGSLNEHVWYDVPTVARIANRVTDFLVSRDRADAATYRANDRAFARRLAALEERERQLRADYGGDGVAVTEVVPLYLLQACGLDNRTPTDFSEAVEDGTDVSPRVLQDTLGLFSGHQVRALVYNAQTTGPQTDRIMSAARSAGVPIVPVTETLPAGKTYYSWMDAQLDALATALGKR